MDHDGHVSRNGHPNHASLTREPEEGPGPATPSVASSGAAVVPQTVAFVGALSAAVVPTLESAQIYGPVGGPIQVNDEGDFVPAQSKRRKFPPALRRLRDRLHTLESRLQLEVNALKQEIADLNTQSALLETRREARRARLVKVTAHTVETYSKVFLQGLSATNPHNITADEEKLSSTDEPDLNTSTQQAFMDAAAHPDMQFGPFADGLTAFYLQWRRYSECHDSIQCVLSGISSHGSPDEPIIVADGVLSGYVTHRMIETVSHRVQDDRQLIERLVGVYVEYPVRKVFHFDELGQVVRLDWSVDFVAALQAAVGSLAPVQRIISGGWILENGYIGS